MNKHGKGNIILMLFSLMTTVLFSCTHKTEYKHLVFIDSIANVNPSKAIQITDRIIADSGSISRDLLMKYALINIKARNSCGKPYSLYTAKELLDYFDKYGNSNDRMLANYILGCFYLKNSNGQMALSYYQAAAEIADTSERINYYTLHKVHGLMARLLFDQYSTEDALKESKLAMRYAWLAKDTFNALVYFGQQEIYYHQKHNDDSAVIIKEKLYNLYRKYGYKENAAISLGSLAYYYTNKKELDKAKWCFEIFEKESGLFDVNGNIAKGNSVFYPIKGLYFLAENKLDSSEVYFREGIRLADKFNNKEMCYRGLSMLYKTLGQSDSIGKYALLALEMNDSTYESKITQQVIRMKAAYDYSHEQKRAELEKLRAERIKLHSIIIISLIIIGVLILSMCLYKRFYKIHLLIQSFKTRMSTLENTNREHEMKLAEKQNEINQLNHTNTVKSMRFALDLKKQPIVGVLKNHVMKDFKTMNSQDIFSLKALFEDYKQISSLSLILTDNEYIICLLVKLGFGPSDIRILMGRSASDVSNIRKRTFKKITGVDGSSKELDQFIKSL